MEQQIVSDKYNSVERALNPMPMQSRSPYTETIKTAQLRTCDTCGVVTAVAFDGLGFEPVNGQTTTTVTIEHGIEACKNSGDCKCNRKPWIFSEQVATELEAAKIKHSFFAHTPLNDECVFTSQKNLKIQRESLQASIARSDYSGSEVLLCELAEAQEAFSNEQYEDCLKELAQCGGVVCRIAEAVKAMMESEAKQ